MISNFTDERKIDVLKNCALPDKIVYSFSRENLQIEAINRIGRVLNEREMEKAEKLLEYGIGENLIFIYNTIFGELKSD